MLRLLLDEHISPVLAREVRAKNPQIEILGLQEWDQGLLLGMRDEDVLLQAKQAGLTLVTYDQRTIAPLLKSWAEAGIAHGVVIIDERTVAPNDFGGLLRALLAVFEAYGQEKWNKWVIYLTPPLNLNASPQGTE